MVLYVSTKNKCTTKRANMDLTSINRSKTISNADKCRPFLQNMFSFYRDDSEIFLMILQPGCIYRMYLWIYHDLSTFASRSCLSRNISKYYQTLRPPGQHFSLAVDAHDAHVHRRDILQLARQFAGAQAIPIPQNIL